MKKILAFVVAVLAISLSSCSPKDDTPSIVGTWKIESALFWESSGHGQGVGQGQAWESECQKNEKFLFTEDKLKKFSYKKQSDNSCLEDVMEATYSISNGYLTYSSIGEPKSFEFKIWSNPNGENTILLIETLPDGKKIARRYKKE